MSKQRGLAETFGAKGAAQESGTPSKRRKTEGKAVETKATVAKSERADAALKETSSHPATGGTDIGPYSLWNGPAGPDPKALSSPAFSPDMLGSEHPAGKAVGFALLSKALQLIEDLKGSGKGSRKTQTVILSNLVRVLVYVRPEDLIPAVYFLSNKVAPDYEDSELGIGDGTLIKSMGEVFGRSPAQIKLSLANAEAADLGEVALLSRASQKTLMAPPKLTIEQVFRELKAIADASGKDSQQVKKDRINKMLVASRGEEAKYIVRTLQGKLRIGIQVPTLLQAIAYAFVLTTPRQGEKPCVPEIRKAAGKPSSSELEARMVAAEAAVKQAFSEMPNFDNLVAALLSGRDASNLHEVCGISLGIPVKPMLAKPSHGITEIAQRLGSKRFTGEWKYDGERAQIHVLSREKISVYSRNSENMTGKYPDVIKVIQDTLKDGVETCIIDCELVAYDPAAKKILPFQVLSTRGRKNIDIDNVKVNVCVFAFDCVFANGVPLVKDTLEARRAKLWTLLQETEGKVKFATYKDFETVNEDEIQTFLDESVAGSCEGLMLKTLEQNASYEPSRRSLNWLKLKKDYMDSSTADSIDVVPIGAFYGQGKRTGKFGAFLLAVYDAEAEEYQTVCKAGTGFSDEDLVQHYEFFKERVLPKADMCYNVTDRMTPDVWLEACQVWEIRAADLSISPVHTSAIGVKADGKGIGLRFPRFLRIRDDKPPEESTSPEQIVEMFENQAVVGSEKVDGDDDF